MNDRRILAIDGGGIKGVIPAAFLATIEETLKKRVLHHFDLVAGTSTGAIIALGLGLGLSAREILEFYVTNGPSIFGNGQDRRGLLGRLGKMRRSARGLRRIVLPKHDPAVLQSSLERAFGERRLGDCGTRIVVPAFDRERRDIHVFKTAHHSRFQVDWRERAVDVAMASAAAPTYLPTHRLESGISFLDGGIWANNPTGLAVVEAVAVLGWEPESVRVLSLGCSESPFHIPERAGLKGLVLKMADVFLGGQSGGSLGTAKLLLGHGSADRFFRYQHVAPHGRFSLDDTDLITPLKGIGHAMARQALPQVSALFTQPTKRFVPCHGVRPETPE